MQDFLLSSSGPTWLLNLLTKCIFSKTTSITDLTASSSHTLTHELAKPFSTGKGYTSWILKNSKTFKIFLALNNSPCMTYPKTNNYIYSFSRIDQNMNRKLAPFLLRRSRWFFTGAPFNLVMRGLQCFLSIDGFLNSHSREHFFLSGCSRLHLPNLGRFGLILSCGNRPARLMPIHYSNQIRLWFSRVWLLEKVFMQFFIIVFWFL